LIGLLKSRRKDADCIKKLLTTDERHGPLVGGGKQEKFSVGFMKILGFVNLIN